MLKRIFSNIATLAIVLGLGFAIYYFVLNPNSPLKSTNYSSLSTQDFFASQLPNENGVIQNLNQYKGKVILLNFWATWCPPCREEMPELSELHTKYKNKNVVVIGLAVDELRLVREFALASPVGYPLLASEDSGMELASNLGNTQGVLPFTVMIDTKGKVVKTYFGRIHQDVIEEELKPLLEP